MNINPSAKRILCYGDSYTWGYIPATDHQRFPINHRWTGILQKELGNGYEVIEEGLNSRTLNSEDKRPGKEGRNGKDYLIPCLDTHDPLDLVIMMLGTNELKDVYNTTAEKIGDIIEKDYVKIILNRKSQFLNSTPKLIIISPPLLDTTKEYARLRYAQSENKNKYLTSILKRIAQQNNCEFIDSNEVVSLGEDGVHITLEGYERLGKLVSRVTKRLLNR